MDCTVAVRRTSHGARKDKPWTWGRRPAVASRFVSLLLCCNVSVCLFALVALPRCACVRLRVSVYVAVCLFVSLRVRTREGRTRVS